MTAGPGVPLPFRASCRPQSTRTIVRTQLGTASLNGLLDRLHLGASHAGADAGLHPWDRHASPPP